MLDSSSSCWTSVTWKMTSNGEMGEMGANWSGNRRRIEVEVEVEVEAFEGQLPQVGWVRKDVIRLKFGAVQWICEVEVREYCVEWDE